MFWYNFDTVLCQFLETGTSDKCVICIVQNLNISCFILYPPFIFCTVPLSMYGKGREDRVYIHYSVTCFTHRSFYCKQVTVTRQEQCRRHRLQSLLLLFLELVLEVQNTSLFQTNPTHLTFSSVHTGLTSQGETVKTT